MDDDKRIISVGDVEIEVPDDENIEEISEQMTAELYATINHAITELTNFKNTMPGVLELFAETTLASLGNLQQKSADTIARLYLQHSTLNNLDTSAQISLDSGKAWGDLGWTPPPHAQLEILNVLPTDTTQAHRYMETA